MDHRFLLAFSIALAGCTEPGDPWYYVEPDATVDDIGASTEALGEIDPGVAQIFSDAGCNACHSGGVALGGLDLSSMAGLVAGGAQAGPAIIACDPDASPLVQVMSGGIDDGTVFVSPMPKGGEQVSDAELQIIKDWIAGGAGLESCNASEAGDDEAGPEARGALSFTDDIMPVFEAYICTTCHANGGSSGGLDVSSVDALMAGGTKAGPAIVPCDPDASPLINVVEGGWTVDAQSVGVMPPFGDMLAPEDIATLRAWIAAGAGLESCGSDSERAP